MEVGGVENHIHILTTLPKDMSLSDFVRIIKTDSSRWIKKIDNCLTLKKVDTKSQ